MPPVFLVADGMGGERAGDVASAIVVSEFDDLAREPMVGLERLRACIDRCESRIAHLADETGAPGSTLVSAVHVLEGGVAYWLLACIGDSRAYIWSHGVLEQMSHDHSVVQELIDAGEIDADAARTHPERHIITRALGASADSAVDFSLVPLVGGSRLLLCSDGITTELADEQISAILAAATGPEEAAQSLVAAAVLSGGRDNATAVVIDVAAGPTSGLDDITAGRASSAVDEDTVRNLRVVP